MRSAVFSEFGRQEINIDDRMEFHRCRLHPDRHVSWNAGSTQAATAVTAGLGEERVPRLKFVYSDIWQAYLETVARTRFPFWTGATS